MKENNKDLGGAAPVANLDQLVSDYLKMKDAIAAFDVKYEEKVGPVKALMNQVKEAILNTLNQTGQDSAKTAHGTAYKSVKTSATIEDQAAFRRHIIGSEAWDLVDWRANPTAVTTFINDEGNKTKEPPPGVKYGTFTDVNIRRK